MGKFRKNPGILGYDPHNKRETKPMLPCEHCWFQATSKSVLTKHINSEHWDIEKSR